MIRTLVASPLGFPVGLWLGALGSDGSILAVVLLALFTAGSAIAP